ncbi:Protein of unknown function DUF1761 [Paracoccaceae bacterium]|jgi:hypothetical protein
MEILNVIVAGFAAFAFGAVWYMSMSKPWMAAAEIKKGPDGKPANNGGMMPFVIGLLGMILAAGMMRHIFGMTAIDTIGKGVTSGLGIGAFSVMPWVAMNYAFGQRKPMLTVIDGINVIVGCGIIGLVLMLF